MLIVLSARIHLHVVTARRAFAMYYFRARAPTPISLPFSFSLFLCGDAAKSRRCAKIFPADAAGMRASYASFLRLIFIMTVYVHVYIFLFI
jgi:hypothetical protein